MVTKKKIPEDLLANLIEAITKKQLHTVQESVRKIISNKYDVNIFVDKQTLLTYAIRQGNQEIVKELLSIPTIDINFCDIDHKTPLLEAVHGNQIKIIKDLLAMPEINVNAVDDECKTALLLGVEMGNLESVTELLNYPETNVNAVDKNHNPSLMLAVSTNNLSMVKLLLTRAELNINAIAENFDTSLIYAARKGHIEIFNELLLVPGVDVNARNGYGNTALFEASFYNNVDILQALLKVKAINIDYVNTGQHTALTVALDESNSAVVLLILESKKINLNFYINRTNDPLLIALKNNLPDVIASLLQLENWRLESDPEYQRNALHYLVQSTKNPELIGKLLSFGIDVNMTDNKGFTALKLAVFHNNEFAVAKLLTIPGIDVNYTSLNSNQNALELAICRVENPTIIKMLIDANATTTSLDLLRVVQIIPKVKDPVAIDKLLSIPGIDVNAHQAYGDTPLLLAIAENNEIAVRKLLSDPRIEVDLRPRNQTALHLAINKKSISIIKMLMAAGADPAAEEEMGYLGRRSAYQMAAYDLEMLKPLFFEPLSLKARADFFVEKRNSLVPQQTENSPGTKMIDAEVVKTICDVISDNLMFLQDYSNQIHDFSGINNILRDLANLSAIFDDEKYAKLSYNLREALAAMGDEQSQRIIDSYSPPEQSKDKETAATGASPHRFFTAPANSFKEPTNSSFSSRPRAFSIG